MSKLIKVFFKKIISQYYLLFVVVFLFFLYACVNEEKNTRQKKINNTNSMKDECQKVIYFDFHPASSSSKNEFTEIINSDIIDSCVYHFTNEGFTVIDLFNRDKKGVNVQLKINKDSILTNIGYFDIKEQRNYYDNMVNTKIEQVRFNISDDTSINSELTLDLLLHYNNTIILSNQKIEGYETIRGCLECKLAPQL